MGKIDLNTVKSAILSIKTGLLCLIFIAYELYASILYTMVVIVFYAANDSFYYPNNVALNTAFIYCMITVELVLLLWGMTMLAARFIASPKQWLITLPCQFAIYALVYMFCYYSLVDKMGSVFLARIPIVTDTFSGNALVMFLLFCVEILIIQALAMGIKFYKEKRQKRPKPVLALPESE